MTTKTLELSALRLDGGTQCRAKLDDEYIATLAAAWIDGAKIPEVTVYHDGSNYWLADGFHRYHAAEKCEFRDILATVISGTRLDAVKHALGANAAHGLRRTNEDKRRAVEIALKEFPKLSDREIGRICAVNHETVGTRRPQLAESASSTPAPRIGADGKTRKLPARTISVTPVEPSPVAQHGFTVRDLGGGVLVKEPVSKSEAYVAENGTVRRMSAIEEEDDSREPVEPQKPRRAAFTMPDRGLFLGRGAIVQLEQILPGDGERTAALTLVRDWCIQQLEK